MNQSFFEFQRAVCLGSEVRLTIKPFLDDECADEDLQKRYSTYRLYSSGKDSLILKGILKQITLNGIIRLGVNEKKNISVQFDEVLDWTLLSLPEGITVDKKIAVELEEDSVPRALTPEQRVILGKYAEEYSWEKRGFRREFILQPEVQLCEAIEQIRRKVVNADVQKLLQNLASGKKITEEAVLGKEQEKELSREDVCWINALLLLSREMPDMWDDNTRNRNNQQYRMTYMRALDYLKENLSKNRKSGRDWFLLACAYQKLRVVPRDLIFIALQKYAECTGGYFIGNTWQLYALLYGDCNELVALKDVICETQEQKKALVRAVVYIMHKSGYDCGNIAWKLHLLYEKYQDENPELLYDYALQIVEKYYNRVGNFRMKRIREALDYVLRQLEENPMLLVENSIDAISLEGVVTECRGTTRILGFDLMAYFYYCGSTRIGGLLNAQEFDEIENCRVIFRRNNLSFKSKAQVDVCR